MHQANVLRRVHRCVLCTFAPSPSLTADAETSGGVPPPASHTTFPRPLAGEGQGEGKRMLPPRKIPSSGSSREGRRMLILWEAETEVHLLQQRRSLSLMPIDVPSPCDEIVHYIIERGWHTTSGCHPLRASQKSSSLILNCAQGSHQTRCTRRAPAALTKDNISCPIQG